MSSPPRLTERPSSFLSVSLSASFSRHPSLARSADDITHSHISASQACLAHDPHPASAPSSTSTLARTTRPNAGGRLARWRPRRPRHRRRVRHMARHHHWRSQRATDQLVSSLKSSMYFSWTCGGPRQRRASSSQPRPWRPFSVDVDFNLLFRSFDMLISIVVTLNSRNVWEEDRRTHQLRTRPDLPTGRAADMGAATSTDQLALESD